MVRTTWLAVGAAAVMAGAVFGAQAAPPVHAAPAGGVHVQRAFAVQGAAEDFLAAAALRPSDLPGGLGEAEHDYLTIDDAATLGGGDVRQALADNGFVAAYDQGFRTDNLISILSGGPAAAGIVITLFGSPAGASAWNSIEAQSAVPVAQQIAGAAGTTISIDSSAAIGIPALGDESSAIELQGSGTISGQSVFIVVDVAFIRRGPAQFTVVVAGLQSQQRALGTLAQALDNRVAAALPLAPVAGIGAE
jgi:hypothetical protein